MLPVFLYSSPAIKSNKKRNYIAPSYSEFLQLSSYSILREDGWPR